MMIRSRIHVVLVFSMTMVFMLPALCAVEQKGVPERVDLFELTYAYGACEVEHSKISRHGPHWVWWEGSAIFCLIDSRESSWLQTSPDEEFSVTLRLKAPVHVSKVSITTKKLFRSENYDPVRWIIEKLDEGGNPVEKVCESTANGPGNNEVVFEGPVLLQNFRLRAFPVDEKGEQLGEGKMTISLSDLSLFADEEVAFIAAAPAPHFTFDKNFYPFVTSPDLKFKMRAMKIYSTGRSFEEMDGVKWQSNDNKVATVDSKGVVSTLAPGETEIVARLTDEIACSVPVVIRKPELGNVDIDVIYIEKWIKDKEGNLVKRDWGEEIDDVQDGESLVFRAHIINAGQKPASALTASWWLDDDFIESRELGPLSPAGGLVPTGETIVPQVPLPRENKEDEHQFEDCEVPLLKHENEMTVDFLEIPYDGKRHTVVFQVVPAGADDSNLDNNKLTVWSDAITFGYYMSEYPYFAYNLIQPLGWNDLPENFKVPNAKSVWGFDEWNTRSSTSYDRLQRITRVFNRQFEISKHKLTPDGITERLNAIMYIIPDPDKSNVPGINCHRFGKINRTIDVIWGLIRGKDKSIANYTYSSMMGAFHKGTYPFIDTPLIHEVSHARYLIDLYGLEVHNRDIEILDDEGNRIFPNDDKEGKKPVYDRKLRCERVKSGHGNMIGGMGYANGWSEHAAYTWERISGRRARAGTWNASPELGEFLNTIPDSNIIKIQDSAEVPLSGVKVEVYQSVHGPWSGKGGGIYSKKVDNEVDITVTTDDKGEAEIGASPFAKEDKIHNWHPKGISGYNGEVNAILKITHKGKSYYKVLTVFESNLGYWHKYGLEIENWPEIKVRSDSKLTYVYTIGPDWTAKEEKEQRSEIPKTY